MRRYSFILILSYFFLIVFAEIASANNKRYFTFIDDHGRVQNIFVDLSKISLSKKAKAKLARHKNIALSDFTNERSSLALPSYALPLDQQEDKRRYYTWVDATGQMQNSYFADKSDIRVDGEDFVISSGELASDYIDSEVLEGRGYMHEGGSAYYTWADASGRIHNTTLSAADRAMAFSSPFPHRSRLNYSEGRELDITSYLIEEESVDSGKPISLGKALAQVLGSSSIKPVKEKTKKSNPQDVALAKELASSCCVQLNGFEKLNADDPIFEQLNEFSPKFQFPMGESYYAAYQLPVSQRNYGLRVRSYEEKGLFYPSLLFLDKKKRPTRLLSDAIYRLHPENWMRYAYIEGIVRVSPSKAERYVVVLTTDDDTQQRTMDNKPFVLNSTVKNKSKNSPFVEHQHAKTGSFELSVVR